MTLQERVARIFRRTPKCVCENHEEEIFTYEYCSASCTIYKCLNCGKYHSSSTGLDYEYLGRTELSEEEVMLNIKRWKRIGGLHFTEYGKKIIAMVRADKEPK